MKILRIISSGYEQGGAENGVVLTNELLRKRGHEVRVISSDSGRDHEHFSDYEFKSVPGKGLKKILYAAYNPDAYRVTKKVLKDFKPDVVLCHTMSQVTASALFALKGYPVLQFVHGPEIFTKKLLPWYLARDNYRVYDYKVRSLNFKGFVHYLYFLLVCRTLYKFAFKNVSEFVSLSSYTQDMLSKEGISSVCIPNGVKLARAHNKITDRKNIVLFAGRLEQFKGIHDLINAFSRVVKEVPDAQLMIAGDGSLGGELRDLADSLGLGSSVKFLGNLQHQKLLELYKETKVFVSPSTWPETFGKVGVEAMSAGVPVVATDVGGVKDWLANGVNGFAVAPHSPGQIAKSVVKILGDKKVLDKMSAAAYKSAQKFSIENFTQSIEDFAREAAKIQEVNA